MPLSIPASISIDNFDTKAETADTTTVAQTITSTSFLTANTARYLATVFNDSDFDLYVKCGANASTTDWAVKIAPQGYYEVPTRYVGVISGVWGDAGSGQAVITEFSDAN